MLQIPLSAVPFQDFRVVLGGQRCRVELYERRLRSASETHRMYVNLFVNDSLLVAGVPCQNGTPIVPDVYFGFVGTLAFYDLQGSENPRSDGLGTRWVLTYNG